MNKEANFFRQKVNSGLSIALIGIMCVWTIIYYFNNKIANATENYAQVQDYAKSE